MQVKTKWTEAIPELYVLDCGRLLSHEGANHIGFIHITDKKQNTTEGRRIADTLKPYLKEKERVEGGAVNTVIFLKSID
jgi:hypothetical protein